MLANYSLNRRSSSAGGRTKQQQRLLTEPEIEIADNNLVEERLETVADPLKLSRPTR